MEKEEAKQEEILQDQEVEETVTEKPTEESSEAETEATESAEQTEEAECEVVSKKEMEDALYQQEEQYLRLAAEYQNYRTRSTEEKRKIYGDAKADAVKELLTVMDTFERALQTPCADENYKKGIELTFAQIQKAFATLGVTEISPLGEAFDPNVHNAIKQVDNSEYESDTVCEVFQKGYLLGDRLIRPAMVAVAL